MTKCVFCLGNGIDLETGKPCQECQGIQKGENNVKKVLTNSGTDLKLNIMGKLSQLIFVGFVALLFTGCAAKTAYKTNPNELTASYNEGFKAADSECLALQQKIKAYIAQLQKELALKNHVLDKFNQVDDKGNLRTIPENTSWDDPKGDEPWMK